MQPSICSVEPPRVRLLTPPPTFQPPPPPPSTTTASTPQAAKTPLRPAEPDLITRYKLQDKVNNGSSGSLATGSEQPATPGTKTKAWSSSREERQIALQRRRDEMILAARRKMEAKIAAEKAATTGSSGGI
ncbi:hypothetical protein ONZ43_g3292 [Nemania bipapillata]|uniref:Uncharacterized protein n=1 Tax=Nemania bipapillata TaxID=110536 RepID=A0ACC2IXB8_9PEZI|nr:hypothetical protein ONZ43_g3292 [Nemania bipapillata]